MTSYLCCYEITVKLNEQVIMATTPPFKYQPMFEKGKDTTEYYLLTKDYVSCLLYTSLVAGCKLDYLSGEVHARPYMD